MISESGFATGWGILAARWKNDVTPALQAVYLEQLDPELDDSTFLAAVKRVVRDHQFFPSIQQIIDAGVPPADVDEEAGMVFRAILNNPNYLPTRGSFFSLHDVQAKHGPVAARAFMASGGERRWNAITDSDTPFALRDFTAGYRAAKGEERARGQLALLGARPPKRLPTPEETRQIKDDGRKMRLLEAGNEVRDRLGLDPILPEKARNPNDPQRISEIPMPVPPAPNGAA